MADDDARHHFEENIDKIVDEEIARQFPVELQGLARHLGGGLLQAQRQKMKEMVLAGMKAITPSLQSSFSTNFVTHSEAAWIARAAAAPAGGIGFLQPRRTRDSGAAGQQTVVRGSAGHPH